MPKGPCCHQRASPEHPPQAEPIGIAQRVGHREPTQFSSSLVAHDDVVLDRWLLWDSRDHFALGLEVCDLARFGDHEVVVCVLGHCPQDAGVAVEFEEAEELPKDEDVTVREQDGVAPEVPAWLHRAISVRVLGGDLRELGAPLVQYLAPHVHQERHRAVARGEEVQPRFAAFGVVENGAGRRTRRLGAGQIADGAELLDQLRLLRGRGAGLEGGAGFEWRAGRRMGGGLRLLSCGLRRFAARDNARSRSEEDDEETARGAGSHRRRLAVDIDVSLVLRRPGSGCLHRRVHAALR